MRASSERIVAAVIAFGCAVALACNALVTFEAHGPPPEAGAVAQDAAEAGPIIDDPCGVEIPRRPEAADAGGTLNIVFAAHTWGFEQKGRPLLCLQPGFNLDGLDTGPAGACDRDLACKPRIGPVPPSKTQCDGEHGVDNSFLSMLTFARSLEPFRARLDAIDLNDILSRAVVNFIVQISDYNGEADDQDVVVTFWLAAGMEGVPLPPVVSFDDIPSLAAVWDGGQDAAWIVDERSIDPRSTPYGPRFFGGGYVRNHRLVVPETGPGIIPIVLGAGSAAFEQGIFTAHIAKEGERWQLSYGRLATRLPSVVMLSSLAATNSGGEQLCSQQSPEYDYVRDYICGALDLPPTSESNNPQVECNTMSVALAFAAIESRLSYATDGGIVDLAVGHAPLQAELPCPDDAGSVYCDDCAWEKPDRCAPQ